MSNERKTDEDLGVITEVQEELKEPTMYRVILLNDDYTPMDFVIHILIRFFDKSELDATNVMMDVHNKGAGVAGIYPLEIAEMKVIQVNSYSQKRKHPLKCIIEKEQNAKP
jgi:ATP-dependent Clp protease adaptor protein ClpS